MASTITIIIKFIACLFGLIIWSTIGVAIWVAKLIRVVAAFCLKATLQAFKAQDMGPAERSIETALAFWPDGVKRILKILEHTPPGSSEIEVTWDKVLPGLAKDALYTLFLIAVSAGFIYVIDKTSEKLLSQLQPKWLTDLRTNEIAPGHRAAGILIGSDIKDVRERFGEPKLFEATSGSSEKWWIYRSGKTSFGILVSTTNRVEQFYIFDANFGKGSALPSIAKAALGSSEEILTAQLGKPLSRRNVSYKPCESKLGDSSAVQLSFAGVEFILCTKNNSTITIRIVK